MAQINLSNILVTDMSRPYVIAEIGHNHMGSVDVCKELIKQAKLAGADAVKLQKRNNKKLYTQVLYNQPYENKNSYGATYGEHREALEFNEPQYIDLIEYSKKMNITFFATPFDEDSLEFLENLEMPFYKIQSADITNFRLIDLICEKNKSIIMSTGGASMRMIEDAVNLITKHGNQLAILHCIAKYPAKAEEINLNMIHAMIEDFPDQIIGFSSHYDGILASVAAYVMGAQIIEQHFTLSHANKGTDHALSLQPAGLQELVHYLDELYQMKCSEGKSFNQLIEERESIRKLGKSMYYKYDLEPNTVLTWENIMICSPSEANAMPISHLFLNYGDIVTTKEHKAGELIKFMDL